LNAPAQSRIFRQAAIDRLSSPDQLETAVALTGPREWIALLALCGLLLGALAWGVLGTIPTRAEGKGLLVTMGGRIVDASTPAAGRIAKLEAVPGTIVKAGEVIATLSQDDVAQELAGARQALAEQRAEAARLEAQFQRERAVRLPAFAKRRQIQAQISDSARRRMDAYRAMVSAQEGYAARGGISREKLEDTRQQFYLAEKQASEANGELLQIDAEEQALRARHEQELAAQAQRVNEAGRRVRELEGRRTRSSEILSPAAGRVTEVKVNAGAVVQGGASIVSLETAGTGLQGVLYMPPEDGKKILPGMDVRIAPSTVKKEEFGTLLGTVASVSEFPVSRQGMVAVLQNPALADQFSQKGAPYEVRVDLRPDPASPSGYRWSSGSGPPLRVSSGTLFEAEVTVREQAPISLVMPLLRKSVGLSR
jgi:HlyD family secretion protein